MQNGEQEGVSCVEKMEEEDENVAEGVLDKPPTEAEIRKAEESGMIPHFDEEPGLKWGMVSRKLYPVL